jgi:DNA-binding transcriptional ArsR family regulator
MSKDGSPTAPTGTTLKVYRYLYKTGRPQSMHDVQRGLNLSSASVAQYHIRKLLQAGLVKEEEGGYVVDRIFYENMIRIKRSLIPFQIAYSVFFATMLGFLIIVLRTTDNFADILVFGIVVTVSALGIFLYEAVSELRKE